MYRISGPIASYALKVDDKNIILFGDMHESKNKQCSPCDQDCIYIVDLLKKMKQKTDLFIESYIYLHPKFLKRDGQTKDIISDVIKSFHKKMHNHNGKQYKQTRIHYSDIRTLVGFQPFWLTLQYLSLHLFTKTDETSISQMNFMQHISWCNTTKKLNQYIDIMLLSNDYIADIRNIIPQDSQSYFVNKVDLMLLQRKYVTRLKKQFNDLPSKYQELILAFHKDMCIKYHKQTQLYDKAMHKLILKQGNITKLDKYRIYFALLQWGVHLKDLYTLARMLYYFDKTNNIISFDGAAHSRIYANFFKKYMDAKIIHKENHFEEVTFATVSIPLPTKYLGLRCVKLPKQVVNDVFLM